MTYTITHVFEDDLLKITISGPFESNRAPKIIAQVWALAQTPGVRILLLDVRELEGRSSLGQIFFNIRGYPTAGTRLRTAVLELPENMELAHFHDTAAGNLGYNIRHFTGADEALTWLRATALSVS